MITAFRLPLFNFLDNAFDFQYQISYKFKHAAHTILFALDLQLKTHLNPKLNHFTASSYERIYDAERAWAEHQERMKEIERR